MTHAFPDAIISNTCGMYFYTFLRHEVLAPREGFHCPAFTVTWDRHLPERRHNMDQVTLHFALNMDSTYTTQDNEDAHVSCPNDAFRKRKFSFHIFVMWVKEILGMGMLL